DLLETDLADHPHEQGEPRQGGENAGQTELSHRVGSGTLACRGSDVRGRRSEVGGGATNYNHAFMLPASLQMPAAIVLLAGGITACFAGYRVFRIVLGIYGFILGALFASSAMGTEHTLWMVLAALVGGIVGALILIAAYFVGVALLGAGVGALAASLIWAALGREPHALVVILFAIVGALAALALQRYVIIGATAF